MGELSGLESWVLQVLSVPPAPEPPEGSPESTQVFHAGRNLYFWCVFVWLVSHLAILAVLITLHLLTAITFARWPEFLQAAWRTVETALFLGFAASAVLSFFSQRLNYRLRWYIVTDHALRIRTGILAMKELTMTYSNIQEIRVTAGPLQNLLNLADVEVQSAGGASGPNKRNQGHIGCFQGVSNASDIRDLLVERLRQYRDSGIGEIAPGPHPDQDQTINAARAVLAETKSLRRQITENP